MFCSCTNSLSIALVYCHVYSGNVYNLIFLISIYQISIYLQGVHGKRVLSEVDHMIEDLQLQDKRNTPSQKLSGGMKRKLR